MAGFCCRHHLMSVSSLRDHVMAKFGPCMGLLDHSRVFHHAILFSTIMLSNVVAIQQGFFFTPPTIPHAGIDFQRNLLSRRAAGNFVSHKTKSSCQPTLICVTGSPIVVWPYLHHESTRNFRPGPWRNIDVGQDLPFFSPFLSHRLVCDLHHSLLTSF